MSKVTARVDADALRLLLIHLHSELEEWSSPLASEDGESVLTRITDEVEVGVYNRLARAFNQLASAYTEQEKDLPPMSVSGDRLLRYWPEDPRELPTARGQMR